MNRTTGARLRATAVVGALSLALLTGCSDNGSDDNKSSGGNSDSTAGSGSSEQGTRAKAPGKAELDKLIIAKGEVAGYEVAPVGKTRTTEKGKLKSDEKCLPLVYVMSGLAPVDAPAETNVMATQEKKPGDAASPSLEDLAEGPGAMYEAMNTDVTIVALSSYDGEGAADAFRSVSDAVGNCSGGFEVDDGSEPTKATKVTEDKTVGATGDEAVAFAVTTDIDDDQSGVVHAQVVRHGNVLASYFTMNIGALMTDKDYTVSAPVVDAQAGKLT